MPPQQQTITFADYQDHLQHEESVPTTAPQVGKGTIDSNSVGFVGDDEMEQVIQSIESQSSLPSARAASTTSSRRLPGAVTDAATEHQPIVFGVDGFGVDEAAFGMLAARRVADAMRYMCNFLQSRL